MKKKGMVVKLLPLFAGLLLACILIFMVVCKGNLLLPVKKTEEFALSAKDASYASGLSVKERQIVDEEGNSVVLRGLMVPDPQKLHQEGTMTQEYFEEVFSYGGNVVRIPIHPEHWQQDEYYLWRYLDPIVEWSVENNMYVILDMHCIGNIETDKGEEMPIGGNTKEYASEFWSMVAERYKDIPNVLFEIYNEPTYINQQAWAENAVKLVDTIRNTGAEQIIIVSGTDYSYSLKYWMSNPIDDPNVIYAMHIYPNRLQGITDLDRASDVLPVIVTEWGYIERGTPTQHTYLLGTKKQYGIPMLQLMQKKGIGWVACWYDDDWEPQMFQEGSKDKTEWGELVFESLAE